jgi:hypothetical protein
VDNAAAAGAAEPQCGRRSWRRALPQPDKGSHAPVTVDAGRPQHLNAREKIIRDNQIVASRMRGLSWATIAATYGLSERQCQTILEDYRASHPRLRERDPIEILDDMLDRYESAQEELALVSATTKHDATRVGAIRTRLDVLAAQANLLMLVGVLPRDLGQLRQDLDVRDLAQKTLAVFDAHNVPVEAKRELLLVLNGNGHPQSLRA